MTKSVTGNLTVRLLRWERF